LKRERDNYKKGTRLMRHMDKKHKDVKLFSFQKKARGRKEEKNKKPKEA